MENASKALLIAAAVLIVILIITIGIKVATSADGIKETAKDTGKVIGDKTEDATGIAIGKINGGQEPISKTDSYVGYYADLTGDGNPEGIIYADLAIGKTGDGKFGDIPIGTYTIDKVNNVKELKDYYIIKKNHPGVFGTSDVLYMTGEGNERFYIMALADIDGQQNGTRFCWYAAAGNKEMSDYSSQTSTSFGSGYNNTKEMIKKWNKGEDGGYGVQNADVTYDDIWGQIQTKFEEDWFVPSREEWAAFAEELQIKDDYANQKLSDCYWSSSQGSNKNSNCADFSNGSIYNYYVGNKYYLRLSRTF